MGFVQDYFNTSKHIIKYYALANLIVKLESTDVEAEKKDKNLIFRLKEDDHSSEISLTDRVLSYKMILPDGGEMTEVHKLGPVQNLLMNFVLNYEYIENTKNKEENKTP